MKWKRGETFTSDMGEREESIAALSRSRRSKAASILRVNSVKIVPVSREQRISLTTRVATLADEENWEMLVSHCRSRCSFIEIIKGHFTQVPPTL